MQTDAHIDWLSFTVEINHEYEAIYELSGVFEQETQGRHGYRKASTSQQGVQKLSDGETGMGTHFIFPATALQNIRALGSNDRDICKVVLALPGKASRLDLAIDILEPEFTVQDCEDAWLNGTMITPAKSSTRTTSFPKGGDTLYIGSRTSERMLRVYNKAIEQNVADQGAWVRMELEIKKLRARATLHALGSQPQTRWVINRAFRDFCDWDNDDYRAATDDNFASIAEIPRKMPNLLHWLQTQVAPAAARYQNDNPGVDIRAILNTWIGAYLVDIESNQD